MYGILYNNSIEKAEIICGVWQILKLLRWACHMSRSVARPVDTQWWFYHVVLCTKFDTTIRSRLFGLSRTLTEKNATWGWVISVCGCFQQGASCISSRRRRIIIILNNIFSFPRSVNPTQILLYYSYYAYVCIRSKCHLAWHISD